MLCTWASDSAILFRIRGMMHYYFTLRARKSKRQPQVGGIYPRLLFMMSLSLIKVTSIRSTMKRQVFLYLHFTVYCTAPPPTDVETKWALRFLCDGVTPTPCSPHTHMFILSTSSMKSTHYPPHTAHPCVTN